MNASTSAVRNPPARRLRRSGLIVGLLIGLALALGVALYVTKAPNPFVNKVPQRSPVQDAAEAERNRNWDPNARAGRQDRRIRERQPPAATGVVPPTGARRRSARAEPAPLPADAAPAAAPRRRAARAERAARPKHAARCRADRARRDPRRTRAPLSTARRRRSVHLLRAGRRLRAAAKTPSSSAPSSRCSASRAALTEREQAGRTVYRVRVGPFDNKEDADAAKEKLDGAGVDSALVRVQK